MQNFDIKPQPDVYPIVVTANGVQPNPDLTLDFSLDNHQASFVQIQNFTDGQRLHVYLNDLETPFTVQGGFTQVFNYGDLYITKIAFGNPNMSGGTDIDIEVVVGLI